MPVRPHYLNPCKKYPWGRIASNPYHMRVRGARCVKKLYARGESEAMIVIHLLISESKYRKGEHVCSAQHSQSELTVLRLTQAIDWSNLSNYRNLSADKYSNSMTGWIPICPYKGARHVPCKGLRARLGHVPYCKHAIRAHSGHMHRNPFGLGHKHTTLNLISLVLCAPWRSLVGAPKVVGCKALPGGHSL